MHNVILNPYPDINASPAIIKKILIAKIQIILCLFKQEIFVRVSGSPNLF